MDWCESNGVNYISGLGPNKVLAEQVFPKLDETCVRRAVGQLDKARDFAITGNDALYGHGSEIGC